jgi:hypothetical protein
MTAFARTVFTLAAVVGCTVLVVRYRQPGDFADYTRYAILLSWQIVFLVIAIDPTRYRLVMIPAILEKGIYVATVLALGAIGQIPDDEPAAAGIIVHGSFGILFLASFLLTSSHPADTLARDSG